jgi:hypothetical protein
MSGSPQLPQFVEPSASMATARRAQAAQSVTSMNVRISATQVHVPPKDANCPTDTRRALCGTSPEEGSDISSDDEDEEIGSDDVDSDDLDEEFFGDDDGKTDSDIPMQQDYIHLR